MQGCFSLNKACWLFKSLETIMRHSNKLSNSVLLNRETFFFPFLSSRYRGRYTHLRTAVHYIKRIGNCCFSYVVQLECMMF